MQHARYYGFGKSCHPGINRRGRLRKCSRAGERCAYTGSGYHKIQLTLIRMTAEAAAMYRAMCAQKGKEGLSGLGDMSCWYDNDHAELQVLKGTTFFTIDLHGLKNPTEPIKAAAKSVLARLQ